MNGAHGAPPALEGFEAQHAGTDVAADLHGPPVVRAHRSSGGLNRAAQSWVLMRRR